MRRYRFLAFWIVCLMALAVIAVVAVEATAGVARGVLAFEPLHIVAHLALYGVLAAALADVRPKGFALPLLAFVAVATMQEAVQCLVVWRPPTADSVFDLGVDLVGGALGLLVYLHLGDRRERAA